MRNEFPRGHLSARLFLLPLLLCLALAAGPIACSRAPAARTAPPPAAEASAEAPAATEVPSALHWARNSAESRALFLQTFALATDAVEELAAGREAGTWGIVTDADETILDNSGYQVLLAERGLEEFDLPLWEEWVAGHGAPPLPGAVAFLERVRELGGRIAVVTNRLEPQCDDTRATLDRQGLPYDVVLCRDPAASRDKSGRWRAVEDGSASADLPPLDVLLYLGDNIGDFPGVDQSHRLDNDASRFEPFGETFFVFPNPMYGSWTGNADRAADREERIR